MKNKERIFLYGIFSLISFIVFTIMLFITDVESLGVNETNVGFATLNFWFHELTDVNILLYYITDWMGLIPLFVCVIYGIVGFVQLIKRKSILKVDYDIKILGIYYIVVMIFYIIFEIIPVNYRPVLIEGNTEASYPSSTTLLVLSVMPTLVDQTYRRINSLLIKRIIFVVCVLFCFFMVVARLLSGVHWITDVVGGILLSTALSSIYKFAVWKGNVWNLTKNYKN